MTRSLLDGPPDHAADLTAEAFMRTEVLLVEATASVTEVWQAMEATGVEHAVVLVDGTCLGIVGLSELRVAWSLELAPGRRTVLPLVVPTPCVAVDTGLPQLCQVLLRSRFGAVMVLDEKGDLQGLVTAQDVLQRLADDEPQT